MPGCAAEFQPYEIQALHVAYAYALLVTAVLTAKIVYNKFFTPAPPGK